MREPADWRVSSYSASEGNCVEVGEVQDAVVVRDTKNRQGGALYVSSADWRKLVRSLKG